MGFSVPILAISISLHLLAFVFAVGAEHASTVYGLAAFGLLLVAQALINGVTKCFCFGRGLVGGGGSTTCAVLLFIFSWVSFLAAEACLLAGSAKNAYHTKYRAIFLVEHLSCATLRKGVFAAGAALTLLSMVASILYYWAHSKADTGGWEKHRNEGLGLTGSNFTENEHRMKAGEIEKV
ncbi:Protein of unknown function (DUF1218 [Striga hermonthica]|uniref:Uncharacterized protein n=1 Tax=Striga hermonthica TaxID=68872 RepID=A0A9N7NP65_STRHE|nr:Protein of unknown function (DUF1218 [Striga hermonthica]